MRHGVRRKWRPPLILVLGGSLLAVLVLPVLGSVVVEALVPALGRGRAVVAVALGALSATVVLGWLLWRLILAPVHALRRRANTIRGGQLAEPMTRFGTPEIGELAEAVLDMADVLQSRELAVRSYSDHVTHELKTPLTAIKGAAELLSEDKELNDEARKLVSTIADAERRAEVLLSAARDIARARIPEHHGTARLSDVNLPQTALDVSLEGADVEIPLSQQGLELVLSQLLSNAEAAGAGKVTVQAQGRVDGVQLVVKDDGPGISDGNRDRVFEPFFTTARDAGGTGMGLAIVQTLILAHGGAISLGKGKGGARFVIDL